MVGVQEIIAADAVDGRDVFERKNDVLRLCMEKGLIPSTIRCPGACDNRPMKFSRTAKVSDKWRWRCTGCKRERSVRTDAFFKDANVPISDWLRFVQVWSQNINVTIRDLQASTTPNLSDRTAGSMIKCIRDMCDRMVFEWPEENLGGNGEAVVLVDTGEKCKGGHHIMLFVGANGEHLIHNHIRMPVKPNSRIYTDVPAPPGVPDNCILLAIGDSPVDVTEKREAAALWWRAHRGVACRSGHGIAAEYTVRRKYFTGAVNEYADTFVDKLREIYVPVFAAL